MNPTFIPQTEIPREPPRQRKAMRPNSLRKAQVMPPHQVDLTLSPSTRDDVFVPAHISGASLLKEGANDRDAKTNAALRARLD